MLATWNPSSADGCQPLQAEAITSIISTTTKDLAIVAGVEVMENDHALARLREERDTAFGDTRPPCDINTLTYNKVHGLADETPCTYGEIA